MACAWDPEAHPDTHSHVRLNCQTKHTEEAQMLGRLGMERDGSVSSSFRREDTIRRNGGKQTRDSALKILVVERGL